MTGFFAQFDRFIDPSTFTEADIKISYLAPGADGASTDVSVFVSPTQNARNRVRGAGETAPVSGTPTDDGMGGMDMGTPEASS